MFSYYLANSTTATSYHVNEDAWVHAKHCLGGLRQSILCNLDETLLAQPSYKSLPGDGQLVQCKNIKPTVEWILKNKHHEHHPDGFGPGGVRLDSP